MIRKLLSAPYPVYKLNRRRMWIILGVGAFVAAFLLLFQPFGTDRMQFPNKRLFLAGYGVVISLTMLLAESVLNQLVFNKYRDELWTVGKQLIWVFIFITLTLAASYLYKQIFFGLALRLDDFIDFYAMTFSIAVLPVIFITLLDYNYQLRKNQSVAAGIQPVGGSLSAGNSDAQLTLLAENKKDQLRLSPNDLVYLQSADNYVEILFRENGQIKKSLLRNTLQRLTEQIKAQHIMRCHRSFTVNLHQVAKVSGNAQGYKLHIRESDLRIPVSRSRSKEVLARLR
ncbi:MAG: LytTR family DNA-binding domain-containing protein [Bacteroidota bacterium]